jgi:serine/threonine protein kinase
MCDSLIVLPSAIDELYKKGFILHRDISLRNVHFCTIENEAVLNDFDHATYGEERKAKHTSRTGTRPFIALDILQAPGAYHQVHHDIESLYWVMCWLVLCFPSSGEEVIPPTLRSWCFNSYQEIHAQKTTFLRNRFPAHLVPSRFESMKAILVYITIIMDRSQMARSEAKYPLLADEEIGSMPILEDFKGVDWGVNAKRLCSVIVKRLGDQKDADKDPVYLACKDLYNAYFTPEVDT